MEKVKCLLCGGTMPADDLEVQVEHMLSWHKATSKEEAEQMAKDNFVNSYPKERPAALHNGFQPIDRRENPRKNFEAQLIVNPLNTADFHVGWIQNISMGGIRLKTEIQPSPFTEEEGVGFFQIKVLLLSLEKEELSGPPISRVRLGSSSLNLPKRREGLLKSS